MTNSPRPPPAYHAGRYIRAGDVSWERPEVTDLERIREAVLELLEPYGVKRVALFGSLARGEEEPDSDIDILVEFEEPRKKPLTLLTWVGLEEELAQRLGRKVDLVSAQGLSRYIRPYVEEDMVVLYNGQQEG